MKQKDWIVIVVSVFVAAVGSYFLSKALFAKKKDRLTTVQIVQEISTDFNNPDKKFFNEKSLNPTQTITIGGNQPAQQTQTKR